MTNDDFKNDPVDIHDLNRFVKAQERVYDRVLTELRNGQKRSHWMWFIFPQVDGLGSSSTARHYAIKSLDEARQYAAHPVLGVRLRECAQILLELEGRSASAIFGFPDDMKFRSSLTLFASVANEDTVFSRLISKYFASESDMKTLEILQRF